MKEPSSQLLLHAVTPGKVLTFTFPTIFMMLFLSLYTMVDGIFIAKFVGTMAFSAVNIVYPVICVIVAVSIMLGTGGNAVIARNMGEGHADLARQRFTFIIAAGFCTGLLFIPAGAFFTEPIVRALGATDLLYREGVVYLRILLLATPLSMLQMLFQVLFVTAERPGLGLWITVAGGLTNVGLDYLLIVEKRMGVAGAGIATAAGFAVPAFFGLVYFSANRKGPLYFTRFSAEPKILLCACGNGVSEMVTNLANAVTTFLFNQMMLRYFAENGVAAITIALYAQFFLSAVYIGYALGVAPVFSFHYGRRDPSALRKVFRVSLGFLSVNALAGFAFSFLFRGPLIRIFAGEETAVYRIAFEGWPLFAVSFLMIGFNIFASALFTAFSDGKTSAAISFLRTFVFLAAFILLLPRIFGGPGIWAAVSAAEGLTLLFSIRMLSKKRVQYQYL